MTERGRATEILEVGPIARRALRDGARGEVRAVFERSLYFTLDGAWICLGGAGLGSGPLNMLAAGSAPIALCRGVGAAAAVAGDRLHVGAAAFGVAGARPWSPPPPAWTLSSLGAGLAALDDVVAGVAPYEGMAALLIRRGSGPLSATAATASAPAAALAEWVGRGIGAADSRIPPGPADALQALLGLGPGLTPSGDDLIGGAMVALHLLDRRNLRDAVWSALGPSLATHTNDISAAHLAAAAEGYGAAALHGVLNALLSGETERLDNALAAITAIGHTSGWDALAGGVIVLRAYRDFGRQRSTPQFVRGSEPTDNATESPL
jgi:hypothetical protein